MPSKIWLVAVSVLFAGCSTAGDLAYLNMAPEQILAQGGEKLKQGRYEEARTALEKIRERDAGAHIGAATQIRIADSYYAEGRFADAAGEYKRFLELYPYNRIASYAQYQLAMCSFKQIDSPDRTPEHTEKALAEFEALLSRYPQSPYADETREKIAACKDHLAEHEYLIGQFYYKKGAYKAALSRFDHLLDKYAHAKVEPSALYHALLSAAELGMREDAARYGDRLAREFPASPYAAQAARRLGLHSALR